MNDYGFPIPPTPEKVIESLDKRTKEFFLVTKKEIDDINKQTTDLCLSNKQKDKEFIMMLRMIWRCGVQQNELLQIRHSDVFLVDGSINTNIKSPNDNSEIDLSDLSIHLKRFGKYINFNDNLQIFPSFTNVKSINRYFSSNNLRFTIHELRKIGIKILYCRCLIKRRYDEQKTLDFCANKFRITPRQVQDIIEGEIQEAGISVQDKYFDDAMKVLKRIETLHFLLKIKGEKFKSIYDKITKNKVVLEGFAKHYNIDLGDVPKIVGTGETAES